MNPQELAQLIDRPVESYALELKSWINPDIPVGKAKIARACLALRNRDGGVLLLGVRDNGALDDENHPGDVRTRFSPDAVQEIVARYASDPFAVMVEYPERDAREYVVVTVPPGIESPVVCCRDLYSEDGSRTLLRRNAVYVRTLDANLRISSAEAGPNDWAPLMKRCFDNREADIGAFFRRHVEALSPVRTEHLQRAFGTRPPVDSARDVLREGRRFFERDTLLSEIELPSHGRRELSAVVVGDVPDSEADQDFIQRLFAAQPRYSGWPAFLDSRHREGPTAARVIEGAWQSWLVRVGDLVPHIDFWRISPRGHFYRYWGFEDDLGGPQAPNLPCSHLEFSLQLRRLAEEIAVVLEFVRAMPCRPEDTSVLFVARWSGLAGRHLSWWASPRTSLGEMYGPAGSDIVERYVTIPLETPTSALAPHVLKLINGVFAEFQGFSLSVEAAEHHLNPMWASRR